MMGLPGNDTVRMILIARKSVELVTALDEYCATCVRVYRVICKVMIGMVVVAKTE